MEERTRYQHYHFIHEYLRDKCLDAPIPALRDFFHEKATEHLKIAWVSLGMLYKDRDEEFIQPEGIEVVPFEIGNDPILEDEDNEYRGLIISALGAWDRVRDESLSSGSLAGVDAEILNQLLFHHP